MKFSERKKLVKVSDIIQIDSMSDDLRNSLWNALDVELWSDEGYLYKEYGTAGIIPFSRALWSNFFKQPTDIIPEYHSEKLVAIRKYFFNAEWYEVYDFIEFVTKCYDKEKGMHARINFILERELSGYRLISGEIVDITDEQEVEMLNAALTNSKYKGVTTHLQTALELFSNRKKPDYRNSIKESISAVESMAMIISGNDKATLGDALKILEKDGKLHPALKKGFSSLYGYTSNEKGIRHAMLDETNLDAADAKYFLLSCTSFVNYLKSKI